MSTTKKDDLYHKRKYEYRQSRIKQTKAFILAHTKASLLNNHKWFSLFEWIINNSRIDWNNPNKGIFKLKTLLSEQYMACSYILELENSAILIDDSGNFIEFLEIEQLRIKKSSELMVFLNELNIEFVENEEYIDIDGYK